MKTKRDNPIPLMTHPLGAHWYQPDISNMLFDDTHVVMTEGEFDTLLEYSTSFPSAVYAGKMWKATCDGTWFLVWYYDSAPDKCRIDSREILIT